MDLRTEVMFLASLGWKLCPMHKGTKNPGGILGSGWQHKCSSDSETLEQWLAQHPDANFGVLLGPTSGIIDVEYDDEQGEQIIEEYAAESGVKTPTYRSSKSIHRLYRYEDKFELEGAKFGAFGTEWRFGQDSAQSVVPPSVHESGVRYQWLDGLSPRDVEPAQLPETMYKLFLNLKHTTEKKAAKAPDAQVPRRYIDGDSLLSRARKHVEESYRWETILADDGWKFCRTRGEAQDWWRPGKTRGSISGTVNYGGSKTLRVFTTSVAGLQPDSSYDKFAYLCATKFNDDPVAAAKGLTPSHILDAPKDRNVDISGLIGGNTDEEQDHEEWCADVVPQTGLIREIFNYYLKASHRTSAVMGLATSLSLCQMLFGRRVTSHTDLRTNDYNVVVAPTASGKEACESAITKILAAAVDDLKYIPMIPPDVQSGNGLVAAVAEKPCGIWVCDEFGKVLEAVLDPRGNGHVKQIATHLLKFYSKASGIYGGAAHAAGAKNVIHQPHLCLLGLTTGQVFEAIDSKQVQDGLIGRLAFWPVQNRPKRRTSPDSVVPDKLAAIVRSWLQWKPEETLNFLPAPVRLKMTGDALRRWEEHSDNIDTKMEHEFESKAAIWGRVAARSMKLALVHRAARVIDDPAVVDWQFIFVERQDVDWGIKVSNWLANISCSLIAENTVDRGASKAQKILLQCIQAVGEIDKRTIMRKCQSITGSELTAAAEKLKADGLIIIEEQQTRGRKKVVFRSVTPVDQPS